MSKYYLLILLMIFIHADNTRSATTPVAWLMQDWRTTVENSTITITTNPLAEFRQNPLLAAQNDNNTEYGNRTYVTYTKTNPATNKVYSGRTSGFGNAGDILKDMDTTHHMNEQGFGPAQIDRYSNNKYAIRSRQKQLIKANKNDNRHTKSTDTVLHQRNFN